MVQETANNTHAAKGQIPGLQLPGSLFGIGLDYGFGGGSSGAGMRTGINSYLHTKGPVPQPGGPQFYTAIFGTSEVAHNLGGTAGAPKGDVYAFGAVAQLQSGATYVNGLTGMEIDTSVRTGSTPPKQKQTLSLIGVNQDAVQGELSDALLVTTRDASTTTGYRTGIQFGRYDSLWPIDTNKGVLIGTQAPISGSRQAAKGIDFSGVTFTTSAIVTPGFTVDPGGRISQATASPEVRLRDTTVPVTDGGLHRITSTSGDMQWQVNAAPAGDFSAAHVVVVHRSNGAIGYPPKASPPANPAEGDTYYDKNLKKVRTWDGAAWQNHW